MAGIYTMDGNELCVGLQGCRLCDEAIQQAEAWADLLGTDVLLDDDDGEWIVHPRAEDGSREPADCECPEPQDCCDTECLGGCGRPSCECECPREEAV